jgi:hypothetical protein
MAKSAKKPDAKEPKAEKKPAAAKKSPPAAKTTMPGSPLIDTSLAASSAASMIAAGLSARNHKPAGAQSGKPESSLFKQLKSGLNKPHSATMDSLLDKTHGPGAQKGNAFQKQVGHNQTTGSDAARINVPRRTAG